MRRGFSGGVGQAPASSEVELVFWQSIANSTNPADFEAYLAQFPNGVFGALARNRLSALGASGGAALSAGRSGVDGVGLPASGSRPAAGNSGAGPAAGVDARGRPGSAFRPSQTCAGQPAGAACWMEIAQQPGCYVWQSSLTPGATVTWTGECVGGFAQGAGTLTWIWDGGRRTDTGHLVVRGKQTGDWVLRLADGGVEEGPYVAGARHGDWVVRRPNGDVHEGPYVDGEPHGHWVVRSANGNVGEGPYVDGELHGDWVLRGRSGHVDVWRFENGEFVTIVER